MKLTILGAAGVRTPLVLQSIIAQQDKVGLGELVLMDVDAHRLELMRGLCEVLMGKADIGFKITWTRDARSAIRGADYVITTFRVGGMESRVIDEQVPLRYGVLGQETTGPGGFAMALRTIPVILDYVKIVREEAPDAWLLNFTNPAGIITEAIINVGNYRRAVGICDNPPSMWRTAAAWLGLVPTDLLVEYFGLNHLGWVRAVHHNGRDRLPELIDYIEVHSNDHLAGLPFEPGYIRMLGMVPNEYNYFYTNTRQVMENLKHAGQSRAQQIMPFNIELYETLDQLSQESASLETMETTYLNYLARRGETYMSIETGHKHEIPPEWKEKLTQIEASAEGYSGVALGVIESLRNPAGGLSILNVSNQGAIQGMSNEDVVEVTCYLGQGVIRPLVIGAVPDHALGLMQQVKEYERLTIRAAVDGSYDLALKALALHPLVPSLSIARSMLNDYSKQHGAYFPQLRHSHKSVGDMQ
jgi:6-phospho-beta-glucosidase